MGIAETCLVRFDEIADCSEIEVRTPGSPFVLTKLGPPSFFMSLPLGAAHSLCQFQRYVNRSTYYSLAVVTN